MKKTKIRATHIITVVCLIAAVVLLCFLFNDIFGTFGGAIGQGTAFEFKADGLGNNGFSREAIVYTEDGVTYIKFSGNITTDGTAEISMITDDDAEIIYSRTYTAVNSEKVNIEVTGLTPQTYYILRFSSNDAKMGHLCLTTEQALVERPEVPERPEHTIPERSPK